MTNKEHVLPHLDKNIFTVVVGNGDTIKSFGLHRNIACARSEFFRACLSGDWKESTDALVELPEDDPEIFQLYTQSLYAGHMHHPDFGHPTAIYNSGSQPPQINDKRYRFLTDLYILSDKMVDIQAKNHAIEVIYDLLSRDVVRKWGDIPGELVEMINTIWDVTPVNAPIRRLLMESVSRASEGEHDQFKCLSDTPPDFLVSVIEILANPRRQSRMYLDDYMHSTPPEPDQGKDQPLLRADVDESWGSGGFGDYY